ncbi:MAG: TonB-dependent receptor [Gemmatimonadetes bacterium]|nr:TonB-dependent receptor [Gemmatimonadota bacterium]
MPVETLVKPDSPWRVLLTQVGILVASMLVLVAGPVSAQQAGRVMGTVVNAQTAEPVSNAQVTVVGTQRGTLTDARGAFVIIGAPAGAQQIQVRSVGFRAVTQAVQVPAGEAVRVEIQLPIAAVALDEVVVTGQALGTARREIGGSIASITPTEAAPVTSVTQMLQAQAPGVTIMPGGGNTGQGSRIVLRGPGSLSQSVEPLIYVDGVRIDNSKVGGGAGGGASWTGLDDIDPADIERIEIIKGASAATMYGSEASGGVIQIFTRRGRGAPQRWDLRTEYGFTHTPREWWDVSAYSDYFYDNFVSTGRHRSQRLGVSGSVEGFSYNLSGSYRNTEGVLPSDWENHGSFRANMTFTPSDRMSLDVNTGYTDRRQRQPEGGNNSWNLAMNALRGGPTGTSRAPEQLSEREILRNSSRFVAGVTATYTPIRDFAHRVTVGFDVVNWDNETFLPFGGDLSTVDGSITNYRRGANTLNFDYSGSYRFDISPTLRSTSSFGLQHFDKAIGAGQASGSRFAAPGMRTVSATANRGAWEDRVWEKSGGFYGEQQIGINDLLFVTAGARFDGHSAFGAEAGYAIYPKMDVSYNMSAHEWFPQRIGTLRLRGAYGAAGQQPGHFDAEMTWAPVTVLEGVPAITPGNLGNPNLGPEITHELDLGFEAGLLEERVGIEFSAYRSRNRGALFNVRYPPSAGFISTQLENVGTLANDGEELSVRGALVQSRNLSWNVRGSYATNRNRVLTLGGGAPLTVAWSQEIREGYPAGAMFEDRFILVNGAAVLASEHFTLRDASGNPLLDEAGEVMRQEGWDYIGPVFPTRTATLSTDMTIGRNLTLSVLGDYKGGHFLSSSTSRWLNFEGAVVAQNEPLYDENDPATHRYAPGMRTGNLCRQVEATTAAGGTPDPIWEASCNSHWSANRGNHIFPADNARLREVTMIYRLPTSLSERVGSSRMSLSLAGRNLLRWQKYPGIEAEANYFTAGRLHAQTYFDTPLPRQVIAGVTVNF